MGQQSDGPKPVSDKDISGLDVEIDAPPPALPKTDITTEGDDLPF